MAVYMLTAPCGNSDLACIGVVGFFFFFFLSLNSFSQYGKVWQSK